MELNLNLGMDLWKGLTITAVELLETDRVIDLSVFDDLTVADWNVGED